MKERFLLLSFALTSTVLGQWISNPATAAIPKIPAAAESGNNAVQGRELLVQGALDGKPATGDILVHVDPATGSFLWLFQPVVRLDSNKNVGDATRPWVADHLTSQNRGLVFAAHDGLFLFWSGRGAVLVTGPAGKATSLDDAQSQALQMLTAHTSRIPGMGTVRPEPGYIRLSPFVFKSHLVPPTAIMGPTKIQSVVRQGGNWEIVVEFMRRVIRIEVSPDLKILSGTLVSVLSK